MIPEPGTILGDRYELESLIGRGGMGRVFRARDRLSDRVVAVKVLNPDDGTESGRADRFKREIGILSRFQHPSVPAILGWGEHEGQLYFASELVDGVELRSENERRGAWPPPDAAALVAKVAETLAVAHGLGIVHRDVNPNNIMIARDGGIRLLDFGIARSVGIDVTRVTTTGMVLGTPGYMSPEQFDARPVDERSDIYSLGVVLFEMLTGRLPFTGQTPIAVAMQHKTEPPPMIRSLRADVPAWLERLVLRCLEKDPLRRLATAAALARELGQTRQRAGLRRRRLASGDVVIEDSTEQTDWALVLSSARQKIGWSPGLALRFEDRYYKLQQIDAPSGVEARWMYRFGHWPESDIFRGVVDYEQDCAERAVGADRFSARVARWLRRGK